MSHRILSSLHPNSRARAKVTKTFGHVLTGELFTTTHTFPANSPPLSLLTVSPSMWSDFFVRRHLHYKRINSETYPEFPFATLTILLLLLLPINYSLGNSPNFPFASVAVFSRPPVEGIFRISKTLRVQVIVVRKKPASNGNKNVPLFLLSFTVIRGGLIINSYTTEFMDFY